MALPSPKKGTRLEETLLSLLLTAMIVLACLQIILRSFFGGGLFWAEPLLRYLVLWGGLLGAVAATGQSRHIAIDLIGNRLPERVQAWLNLIIQLFSAVAAAGLTWAAWRFLRNEIADAGTGPLDLPLWLLLGIFPASFALITLRYLLLLGRQGKTILAGNRRTERELRKP
jgi:TRAP-type C4-dicarboxylate transport system permease small subunit